MRYFMYSPWDMNEHEAFETAKEQLSHGSIVHVQSRNPITNLRILLMPGSRPQALPNTYLVRVEPDDSLRIVEKRLD